MTTEGTMRNVLWLTLAAVVVLGGAVVIVPRLASPLKAEAIVAAMVICVGAGWLAMLPPLLVAGKQAEYLMGAGLAMILIRLFVTLGLGFAYLRWADPEYAAFVTAMVVCYLTLLVAETGVTALMARRLWNPPMRSVH